MLPIAQAFVLRWVLMGGISTNQTCLAWPLPVVSWCQYGSLCPLFGGVVLCGKLPGRGWCGVVFGALLGPEATGPFCSNAESIFWCFFCSCSRHFRSLFTVPFLCVGVVVVGVWLTGLLFENYIVDASI